VKVVVCMTMANRRCQTLGRRRRGEAYLPESLGPGSQQGQDMKARSIVGVHNMGPQTPHAQALP